MRVILKEDIIIKVLDPKSKKGVEIGDLPLGMPFDITRIRWNGTKIVDLTTLDEIHVRYRDNLWTLHSIDVEGSQLVTMKFWKKKWLIDDAGTYRVLTVQEFVDRKDAGREKTRDNRRLRKVLKNFVRTFGHDKIDQHIDDVFGNMTTAQKNSLKKLYKVALVYAKQQSRERS